jgi:hypothetical protein
VPGPKPVKSQAAEQWLIQTLVAAPMDGAEVYRLAYAQGISESTLTRVSKHLVSKDRVEGSRTTTWTLLPLLKQAQGARS